MVRLLMILHKAMNLNVGERYFRLYYYSKNYDLESNFQLIKFNSMLYIADAEY
jgi:hypothetical protein